MKGFVRLLFLAALVWPAPFVFGDAIPEDLITKAENGDTTTQYELGKLYLSRKDTAGALKWFRQAAEKGDARAQYEVGRICNRTDKEEEAHEWMAKAANQGYAPAQCAVGASFGFFSPEGAVWFRKSAEQGYAMAQNILGMMYQNGWGGLTQSAEEAVKWYRKAALRGYAAAQDALGSMYKNGIGVSVDDAEAVKWYRDAAEQGYADAQFDLGIMYANGYGVQQDGNAAKQWFFKAAMQGNGNAEGAVSAVYSRGMGVAKDEVESLAWAYVAEASGQKKAEGIIKYLERDALGPNEVAKAKDRSQDISAEIQANEARRANDSFFSTIATTDKEMPESSGSGTIVSSQGYVLTAAHVVAGANSIKVVTSQGTVPASVLNVDEANDLAVLKITGGPYQPLPIVSSRGIRLGRPVATIGFPNVEIQGFSPKVTRGEISSLNGVADDPRSWQVSVPVQPGNSGGPLLDENGNLIGVVESKLGLKAAQATGDIPQSVTYAVKSAYALALLEPYLESNAPAANPRGQNQNFEDMVAKAQQSVVLILVY